MAPICSSACKKILLVELRAAERLRDTPKNFRSIVLQISRLYLFFRTTITG